MKTREDWLVEQLNRDDLNPTLVAKYEAELDALALRYEENKKYSKLRATELKLAAEKERFEQLENKEKALARAMDMDYEAWLTLAKSLYEVDGSIVRSIARGPDNVQEWSHESHLEAREHVFKLIYWKYYDHFTRGSSFTYVPPKKQETA